MKGTDAERGEQLVVELLVRDLDASLLVYEALGFRLERRDGGFAALQFDGRRLFLAEHPDLEPVARSRSNVRIMVPDVDALLAVAEGLGLTIEQPVADRYYGLRDFTVRDPDGHGLRFASVLPLTGRD